MPEVFHVVFWFQSANTSKKFLTNRSLHTVVVVALARWASSVSLPMNHRGM